MGASMIFSSIAAVHAVALAAVRGRGTVDLDIIPVYSLTGVGMLTATPMLIWSKTLREAPRSVRLVIFLWIGVMYVGVLASTASMKALPSPIPCDPSSKLDTCDLICNVTLPMRGGQSSLSIPFFARNELFNYSAWAAGIGCGFAALGLMIGICQKGPLEMAQGIMRHDPYLSRKAQRGLASALSVSVCCGLFVVLHIVLTEHIMLGKHHVPLGEDMSAIGQWGSLVGACFALFGTLIKKVFDRVTAAPNGAADVELAARASAKNSDV